MVVAGRGGGVDLRERPPTLNSGASETVERSERATNPVSATLKFRVVTFQFLFLLLQEKVATPSATGLIIYLYCLW